jgi:hypothetical protein
MPRPRTPTEILEIPGAFIDQPGRRRPAAPRSPEPIGDPPEELAPDVAACWREIVAEAPPGVLTDADRKAVEVAAVLHARLRAGIAKPAQVGLMLRALGEMGMTTASRRKVAPAGLDKPEGATPWGFLRSN